MPLAFAESLLMHITACTERVCHLQHYSQVVAAYTTLQTICSLTVSTTGLPRAHSVGVAYQDVKEPWYIIAKNAILVTVSRAVCKVYLR